MDYIDLHTHSTASDGTFTPSEVYASALEINLTAVALTDHDTVDGIGEFVAAGKDHPECEAVPGVEIACQLADKEIHIIGLFIDRRSKALNDLLDFCRNERMRRNRDIFLKLHFLGIFLAVPNLLLSTDLSLVIATVSRIQYTLDFLHIRCSFLMLHCQYLLRLHLHPADDK